MKSIFTILKKTLFWSYERGSWQYDIMCVLILAFIFFAPNRFFHSSAQTADDLQRRPIAVNAEDIGAVAPEQIEQAIAAHLSKVLGHPVAVQRVERVTDQSGKIIYLVTEQ